MKQPESLGKQLRTITLYMGGLGLLFVGWVILLNFPWGWVVPAVAIFEVLAIILVLFMERSAQNVDGAGGWMVFAFLMGHAWLFLGAAALRAIIWLPQLFFS